MTHISCTRRRKVSNILCASLYQCSCNKEICVYLLQNMVIHSVNQPQYHLINILLINLRFGKTGAGIHGIKKQHYRWHRA